jgi:hypothetical protein
LEELTKGNGYTTELLARMVEVLGVVMESVPLNTRKIWIILTLGACALGSPWNQTVCKILLDKYLFEVDLTKQSRENVLRLLQLVLPMGVINTVSVNILPKYPALAELDVEVHQNSIREYSLTILAAL